MGFLQDLLRVGGTITAATLAATGVGIPLAVGIGAGVTAGGNLLADEIDRGEEKENADRLAQEKKQEVDRKIEERRQEEKKRAEQTQRDLQKKLDHEALPGKIIDACKKNELDKIPSCLQRMDNEQFEKLGNTPLSACTSADARQQVREMLKTERKRKCL